MKLAIYRNDQPHSIAVAEALEERLAAHVPAAFTFDDDQPDLVITVGGDGTLLAAFHHYAEQVSTIRFIGVHTGHLGFYADWRDDELDELVTSLLHDEGNCVTYPLLAVQLTMTDGQCQELLALNEVVIKQGARTLFADVCINGDLFEHFRGDGLSIATPTGSTAYNKAVGGAIMAPSLASMQLTEVASINNRVYRTIGSPIILTRADTLTLQLGGNQPAQYVIGYDHLTIESTEVSELRFTVAKQRIQFAEYRHRNFWKRVQASFIGVEE